MTQSRSSTSIRRRAVLALLRLFASRGHGEPPLDPASLHRVLLMRYDRIGDMVITTPLIDALKQIAPQCEIDVLASPVNASVLRDDPRIAHTWIWPNGIRGRLRTIRACRRRRYDLVLQLILGRTTLPALLAGLLAPHGRTVGNSVAGQEFMMNYVSNTAGEHFSDRTFAVLSGAVALSAPLHRPPYRLIVPESDRRSVAERLEAAGLAGRRFIVLNISAGTPDRELSDHRNIELARELSQFGCLVAVTGAPGYRDTVERIAAASGSVPLVFGSILAAAEALGRACLLVSPDTGTIHVASAMGTPVVALFPNSGNPAGWRPDGVPYRVIAVPSELVADVNLPEVIVAVRDLIDGDAG
ncbi:MAG: glycosyltransferase family 9 protein [Bacteroidetes bacterium]|nr:glycosyltransferase family 9 protein [Bacteroidota bacterium]